MNRLVRRRICSRINDSSIKNELFNYSNFDEVLRLKIKIKLNELIEHSFYKNKHDKFVCSFNDCVGLNLSYLLVKKDFLKSYMNFCGLKKIYDKEVPFVLCN